MCKLIIAQDCAFLYKKFLGMLFNVFDVFIINKFSQNVQMQITKNKNQTIKKQNQIIKIVESNGL